MRKKLFSVFSILVLLSMLVVPVSATPAPASATSTAGGAPVIEPDGAQGPAIYIIQLADQPVATYTGGVDGFEATSPVATGATKLDAKSPASLAYAAYLEGKQADAIAAFNRALGRQLDVKFQYQHAYNGIAAEMTPAEARLVAQVEGVTQVYRETIEQLTTDAGPAWIGAPDIWNGVPLATKGEGVIAGIIDTGINHDHPSFADIGGDGYNHTNPYGAGVYVGWCVANPSFCNDKLIGAWNFVNPGTTPEDDDGHGSHTSSTVAGNVINDADFIAPTIAYTFPTISGVAPHANVIMYKACGTGGCPGSATTASVNQAVLDGVDVLNYSISGGTQPYTDPTSQAFLNANTAGVFAAASAGNNGPTAGTTNHKEPWNLTVAASTHDRAVLNSLVNMSGGGSTPPADILGEGATLGYGPASIVYAGNYGGNNLCAPFPVGTFSGQIVVCDRGTYGRVEKGQNVLNAGGGGMVLVNDPLSAASLNADGHVLPATHISYADGTVLKTWLASGSGHMATITGGTVSYYPEHGDNMASFSSRGPSGFNLIKPDVTAPGLNILAAYATLAGGPPAPEFNIISGTSMSSPHSAGAAVLMRALHPTWSPTQIKSAMMMTGVTSVFKEDNTTPADPYDMGAGRLSLGDGGAMDVGFVLDITRAEYDAANPTLGGDMGTLNLPSMSSTNCAGFCSWMRTLESVQAGSVDYTVSTSGEPGLVLTVDHPSFTLGAGGTQEIVITADVVAGTPGETLFGDVTFTPSDPNVAEMHMPVAVVVGAAPAQIEVTPETLNSTQFATAVTQTLTISNLGDATLDWSIYDDATPIDQPTVDWTENFDSYVTGSQIHGQGGWKGWFNDPSAGALVSDAQSRSAPNSVAILGASDLVHEYAGYNSGRWTYTAHQYIPSGTTGQTYFILLNTYNDAGTGLNWSVQVLFDAAAGVVANDGTTVGTLPLITDQWVELRVEIDLVNDRQDFYYGGQLLYTSTWTGEVSGNGALNIGAVDLFANGASVVYYDDISLVENPLQICDIPGDVPWLSASPDNGSTLGGASSPVYVGFDATGMMPGDYTATLCVASNDFLNPVVAIPVTMTVQEKARLEVGHLAPFAADPGTAVTVTLDGTPVLTGFEFADSTGYLDVSANVTHTVEIFPAGSTTPAISADINLMPDTDYTAIAVGGANGWDLGLQALVDDNTAPAAGKFHLRLGHLAPFAATAPDTLADIRLQDGTPVLTDVVYGDVTAFIPLDAGTYDLKITTSGGAVTLIDPKPVTFNDGDIISAYAVGDGVNQPLGVFAWPAGAPGFLLPLETPPAPARLEVGHLAPFAMDPGTAVTVTLDGTDVLTGFEFAQSTGYLEITPGITHTVEIFAAGVPTPAISAEINLMSGMDYTAIAVGGANGWPLDLLALVDDNSAPAAGNFKLRLGHLAPFADTITGTLADVRLQDGTIILNDVPFGAVAAYLELPAGSYDLKITSPDGATTYIDPLPVPFNDGDIVSAFAVGDGVNQPLGVFAWPAGVPGFLLPLAEPEPTGGMIFLPLIPQGYTP